MISRKAAEDLPRKTVQNSHDILALYELLESTDGKVDNLTTDVGTLTTNVGTLTTDVANLTTHVADLDAKFEANSNQVNSRFDAHEKRFDHLDGQMTEVLTILRGKAV